MLFSFCWFCEKKNVLLIYMYIYVITSSVRIQKTCSCSIAHLYIKKNSDYIVALYHLLQVLHVKSDKTSIQLFRKKYNVSKRNVTLTWGLETTREFELYFTFYYTVQIRTIMNSISLRLDPISLSQNKHAFWTV